jgi:phospholipase/carboxylesterase
MPPDLHRRDLIRLAGAGLFAAITGARGTELLARSNDSDGRLASRPRRPSPGSPPTGLLPLQLSGSDRDGAVYVPASYRPESPAPFVLSLHGATGSGRRGLRRLQALADEAGLIVLVPDSRDRTWDVAGTGRFGADVEFLDRALDLVFTRYAVDPARVVVEGFSDGASYALSLGLLNGDLFTHVIAFSPGFVVRGKRRGKPRLYVSHGVHDRVLPIDLCSRRIVKDLRDDYDLRYIEFEGDHTVPPEIARAAVEWVSGRA